MGEATDRSRNSMASSAAAVEKREAGSEGLFARVGIFIPSFFISALQREWG
jgi:hypothetical protein